MKNFVYSLIVILPPLIFAIISLSIIYCHKESSTYLEELKRLGRTVFPGIVKAKTTVKIDTREAANKSVWTESIEHIKLYEEKRWLLKDIDITDLKDKVFFWLFLVFLSICYGCTMIFWRFLLLDTSFSCDDDDNTKECFEYHFWSLEALKTLGKDPIDCNSVAVQNGTVRVVCYEMVFNFGLAAGASLGVFKFTVVVLNVTTSLMVKFRKRKAVCISRGISFIFFMGLHAALIAIQATSSFVSFMGGNLVTIIQMITVVCCAMFFLFGMPWKELVDPPTKDSQETSSLSNGEDQPDQHKASTEVLLDSNFPLQEQ